MVLVGGLCRKWQYAENALQDPDPFEADTILDAHDVKVPIPRFARPAWMFAVVCERHCTGSRIHQQRRLEKCVKK